MVEVGNTNHMQSVSGIGNREPRSGNRVRVRGEPGVGSRPMFGMWPAGWDSRPSTASGVDGVKRHLAGTGCGVRNFVSMASRFSIASKPALSTALT